MPNYILVRETLDWENASYSDLRDDAIRTLAGLWDNTFTLRFTQCRAAIKYSTFAFFAEIDDAEILASSDMAQVSFGDDDLLLVADDDDWYRPDVFTALRKRQVTQHQAALWPDGVFGYHICWDTPTQVWLEECLRQPKLRPLSDGRAYSAVKTNNYMVTRRLMPGSLTDIAAAVMSHEHAAQALTEPGTDVMLCEEILSLVNRHPCSYLVLNYGMEGQPSRERLKALVSRYVQESAYLSLPEVVSWAQPYIASMRQLFVKVLESAR